MIKEDRKYFRLAASEHPEAPGKYGIVAVVGDASGPDGGVMPIGPCDSSTPDQAIRKFARALESIMGPFKHPNM